MLIFKHKWIYNKQTTSTVYYISYVESQNVTKSLLNNYYTCRFTISDTFYKNMQKCPLENSVYINIQRHTYITNNNK